jgi:hypothetical protein
LHRLLLAGLYRRTPGKCSLTRCREEHVASQKVVVRRCPVAYGDPVL